MGLDTIAFMASNPAGTDARTDERILYLLKTQGPQPASALAQRLHLTAMAVRQHLYRFREEGLVKFSSERRPVGRPAQIWMLTERAAARFPESHAELTLEIISAIRAAFGEEGLDKLIEGDTEAGEKLIDKAKQIDPKAVEELAEKVERDKENAERFVNKG